MKKLFCLPLAALSFISFSASSMAEENECVAGEAIPEYSAKTAGISAYVVNKNKKDNLVTEAFTMPEDVSVKLTQGGCAHFSRNATFTIRSPKDKNTKFESKYWVEKAKNLLAKLPASKGLIAEIKDDVKSQEKQLLKQKASLRDNSYTLEATDKYGYNTVYLNVTEKKPLTEISVGVDTAL